MRSRFVWVFALICPFAFNTGMNAQNITPCVEYAPLIYGVGPVVSGNSRSPAPGYTATVRHTFEQRLADGNAVHYSVETTEARDADGRSVVQRVEGCDTDADGRPQPRVIVSMSGADGRLAMTWSLGPYANHYAQVFHPRPRITNRPPAEFVTKRRPIRHEDWTTEELGTTNIAGISAVGTRRTRAVPPGVEGNDLPFKIVEEQWTSADRHVVLRSAYEDPRRGRDVIEVQTITFGPPDTALFAPPAGYAIWDPDAKPVTDTKP